MRYHVDPRMSAFRLQQQLVFPRCSTSGFHKCSIVDFQFSEVTSAFKSPVIASIFFFLVRKVGTDPKVSSENHQKILMEEEDEPRKEPKDDGAGDLQHFGENSLSVYIILQCFS